MGEIVFEYVADGRACDGCARLLGSAVHCRHARVWLHRRPVQLSAVLLRWGRWCSQCGVYRGCNRLLSISVGIMSVFLSPTTLANNMWSLFRERESCRVNSIVFEFQ